MAKTTWILVANSSKAKIFQSKKPYRQMELIKEFEHPESRLKTYDLVTDNNGRYFQGKSPAGVYEVATPPKKVEAEKFAHHLAEEMNAGRSANQYKNLVLIAPAHFHGLLRKYLSHHVKNLIIHEIEKDYTKIKGRDLPKYLDGKLTVSLAA